MDALRFATTKIQPPRPRATRVARPRLDGLLADALGRRRVVLIAAPAGFGKTSLLAAQIAQLPAGTALAWVSLDEDDDPSRLFACLAAALEPYDLPWRSAPEALAAQVGEGDGAGAKRAVTELLNALAGADVAHGVIVLDDLHRVQAPQVHALLDALLERLPPQWLLVFATRVEPPLALARWRAADELAELQQEDLRFRADEAAAVLAAEPDSEQLRERLPELLERTQGWPAGLRLCIAALRTRPGAAGGLGRRGHGAVDRALFDYLASEVLDDMPAELHDFLVRSAVLPALTAARAAAVTGDMRATERLDEIERRGLFATALEANERTLVLHDLFRDALDDRLRKRFPDELPALLRRAAESEADPVRRVGFELRAGDWAAAENTLVENADEMLLQGLVGELVRLAAQFPADWRRASPRLLRLQGLAACMRWEWTEMRTSMQAAVEAANACGDVGEAQLAQTYLIAAYHATGRIDDGRDLIAALQGKPLGPRAATLLLHGECNQRFQRGDYQAVPALCARLVEQLVEVGSLFAWWECAPPSTFTTLPGIARLLERYAREALARCGDRDLPMRATFMSTRAYLELWSGPHRRRARDGPHRARRCPLARQRGRDRGQSRCARAHRRGAARPGRRGAARARRAVGARGRRRRRRRAGAPLASPGRDLRGAAARDVRRSGGRAARVGRAAAAAAGRRPAEPARRPRRRCRGALGRRGRGLRRAAARCAAARPDGPGDRAPPARRPCAGALRARRPTPRRRCGRRSSASAPKGSRARR